MHGSRPDILLPNRSGDERSCLTLWKRDMRVGIFCTYWTHRLLHTRLFWPLHVFHHAAERFTVATTYRVHPLDLATGFLSKLIIPLLLGLRPDLVLAGAVVFKVQALYAHSNLPEQPWLGRWLSFGPRGHGLHHSLDPRHRDRNFGSFVLWDRLFGTYLAVDGP